MAANDHPIPRSPPELLDLYIDASKDSFPALSQLSLVSKRCMLRARKHMFGRIQLGRVVRYAWGPGEEDYIDGPDVFRINDLLALLNANEMLATYPRYLDLDLGPLVLWDLSSDAAFAFTQALPAILRSLHHLVSLRISSTGCDLPWDSLPINMLASVARCSSGPRITSLEFSGFTNFPFSLISSSPSLETLKLTVSGKLVAPARVLPTQRIKTLISPAPCSPLMISYAPETFIALEELHWGVTNQIDWLGYCIVSLWARDSLRRVKLEFKTRPGGHPIYFEQRSPPFQGQIKHLTISSRLGVIIGTPTFSEPQTIFDFIRITLRYQQMLKSLESLTIEYPVPILHLHPVTDFIIGGNQNSWRALDDEISSSECRDRIKIEIVFSVTFIKTRVEEASEGTKEQYQVLKDRMVEEARAALPRTAGNGRLEMSFTFASATPSDICPHAALEGFSFVQ